MENDVKPGFVPVPSEYVLGIDLGTTNSSVAIYSKGMQVLPLEASSTSLPSVVRFENRDLSKVVVGKQAKKYIVSKPNEVFSSFKTQMTNGDWETDSQMKDKFLIGGQQLTPTDMAVQVLSKIRETIQDSIYGERGTLCKAIICVPAQSQPTYVNNVYLAAEKAGFGEWDKESGELIHDENGHIFGVKILEEPTAAAIAYGLTENFFGGLKNKNQHILVYDLGGGTFDITLLKIETRGKELPLFTVIAKGGNSHLGGDNLDWAVVDILAKKITKECGTDVLDGENSLKIKSILKDWAEQAKIEFANGFTESSFTNNLTINGAEQQFDIVITKEEFMKAIQPMIDSTIVSVKDVLKDAQMDIEDINRIVLVGGSCKGPWVKETIKKELGREPYQAENVDTIVAAGASFYGSDLVEWPKPGEMQVDGGGNNIIVDSSAFYFGFELSGGLFKPMVLKGEKFNEDGLISRSGRFTNSRDSEMITISGFSSNKQLEIKLEEDNNCTSEHNVREQNSQGDQLFTSIGDFDVTVPKAAPGTLDIRLTMTASIEKWIKVTGTVDGNPIADKDIVWNY